MKTKSSMKTKSEKRTHEIKLRATAAEVLEITELARASGLTVSEFMRRVAHGKEINAPRPVPPANREQYIELGRISGNLQRIFSTITSDKKWPADIAKQLATALVLLKKTCGETQKQLLGVQHED